MRSRWIYEKKLPIVAFKRCGNVGFAQNLKLAINFVLLSAHKREQENFTKNSLAAVASEKFFNKQFLFTKR
jgi:hypothetical protein